MDFRTQLFTAVGDQVLSASGEEGNAELWSTDGTEQGVTRVKDIYPGSTEFPGYGSYLNSSNPSSLVDHRGTLYFAATSESGT